VKAIEEQEIAVEESAPGEPRPRPRRPRRRPGSVERTLATFVRRTERAFYAEELARTAGLLQTLDPRVKVCGLLLLLLDAALARNLLTILCVFAVALALAMLSRVPVRTLATRAWLGAFLFTAVIALPAVFITPGRVVFRLPLLGWPMTQQGIQSALYLVARVETAVTLSLLLVLCTPWTQVLKALSSLGVPVVFVVILGMTYRYVFLLLQTAREMFESRQSRTVGALDGPTGRRLAAASAGVLLARTFQLSGEVYLAMQSRGFSGEVYTLDDFGMRRRDWLALVAFVLASAALLWLGRRSFALSSI